MKLASRLTWIFSGRLIGAALQAFVLILVARSAGSSDFGVLAAFMGLVIVVQTVFDFGLFSFITRLRVNDPSSSLIGQSLGVHKYVAAILCCFLLAISCLLSTYGGLHWWTLAALAVAGAVDRQADVRLTVAMADGDVWKNTSVLVLRRLLTFMLFLGLSETSTNSLLCFGVSSLIASVASLCISQWIVKLEYTPQRINRTDIGAIFRESKHFWVHSLGTQLRNFDVFVVAMVSSAVIAGYYGAIARSLNPLMMLSSSLSLVLFPMAVRAVGKDLRKLLVPVGLIMSAVFCVYGVMAIYASALVEMAFGEEYLPSVPGFKWVLLGLVFYSISSVQASFLQAQGSERAVGRISIAISVVAVLGIGCGAHYFGVTGASIALTSSYVLQCLLFAALVFAKTGAMQELNQVLVGKGK